MRKAVGKLAAFSFVGELVTTPEGLPVVGDGSRWGRAAVTENSCAQTLGRWIFESIHSTIGKTVDWGKIYGQGIEDIRRLVRRG